MAKKMDKHIYSAKLVRVVDGDTADAMIDLGFNVWVKNRIRFMGVDAWESRTRNLEEKEKGLAAKEFVKKFRRKNEINYENLSNFLNKESNEQKVIDFAKVVNLNYINISEAIFVCG